MTLSDTGPLVALIDLNDRNHARCVDALPSLRAPLLTTWSCFTEAMYLLWRAGGYPAQEALWQLFEKDAARLHRESDEERVRMRALMEQYRDTPMDLADASLVAAAEQLGIRQIFTLDSDFYVYRVNGVQSFAVVP